MAAPVTMVGGNRVIGVQRLILSKPAESWVTLINPPVRVDMCLVFEDDNKPDTQRTIKVEGKSDHARIIFHNWSAPLGVATVAPVIIGKSGEGEILLFDAVVSMIGSTRVVDVQVVVAAPPPPPPPQPPIPPITPLAAPPPRPTEPGGAP